MKQRRHPQDSLVGKKTTYGESDGQRVVEDNDFVFCPNEKLWCKSLGLYIALILLLVCLYEPTPTKAEVIHTTWCSGRNVTDYVNGEVIHTVLSDNYTIADHIDNLAGDVKERLGCKNCMTYTQSWPWSSQCVAIETTVFGLERSEPLKEPLKEPWLSAAVMLSVVALFMFICGPPTLITYSIMRYRDRGSVICRYCQAILPACSRCGENELHAI